MERQQIRNFERHAQTGLVLLVVALLAWIANTVQESTVQMATVQVKLATIQRRIDNVEPRGNYRDNQLQSIEIRLSAIESEIGVLRRELKHNGNSEKDIRSK